jgi:hypothetical protein
MSWLSKELHSVISLKKTVFFLENIPLLANKILKAISNETSSATHSSVIHSSPDESHCDQMGTILQLTGAFPWQSSSGHTAESMVETVIKEIMNCGN